MSQKYYSEPSETVSLWLWVSWQMLRGAGWAAALILALVLILVLIWGVGEFLPEESKNAPSPYTSLEIAAPEVVVA